MEPNYKETKVSEKIVRRLIDKVSIDQARKWFRMRATTALAKELNQHPGLSPTEAAYIYKAIENGHSSQGKLKVKLTGDDIGEVMGILDYRVPYSRIEALIKTPNEEDLLKNIMELTSDPHKVKILVRSLKDKRELEF